jgi:hypothetical protein
MRHVDFKKHRCESKFNWNFFKNKQIIYYVWDGFKFRRKKRALLFANRVSRLGEEMDFINRTETWEKLFN